MYRLCHKQGGGRLLLAVVLMIGLVVLSLMFVRDWGSVEYDTSSSGYMVKAKIVITHLQVGRNRPDRVFVTINQLAVMYTAPVA